MQQVGIAQEFNSKDIKLLLEAVTKHLWHSESSLEDNDLQLKAYIRKALRKPTIHINKAPYCVLHHWDDIMAFMMHGTHLDKEVHTAEDLSNLVQQGFGNYSQTSRNKGNGSDRAPTTSTKITFNTESATKQVSSSQQHEGDRDTHHKNTREDRNNQQGERTGGNNPDDSNSGSSSHSGSSSTSLVRSILQLRNNNQ